MSSSENDTPKPKKQIFKPKKVQRKRGSVELVMASEEDGSTSLKLSSTAPLVKKEPTQLSGSDDSFFIRVVEPTGKQTSKPELLHDLSSSDSSSESEEETNNNNVNSTQEGPNNSKLSGSRDRSTTKLSEEEEGGKDRRDSLILLSDSDSSLSLSTPSRKRTASKAISIDRKHDRKRRSISLTPPPELAEQQIAQIRGQLRQSLQSISSSITSEPVSLDVMKVMHEVELDPELKKIALRAAAGQLEPEEDGPSTSRSGDMDAKIEIKMTFVKDPGVGSGMFPPGVSEEILKGLEKPLKFIVRNDDIFENVITNYATRKFLPPNALVFVYVAPKKSSSSSSKEPEVERIRLWQRGTPASLGMGKKVHVEVYTKEGYQWLCKQEERQRQDRITLAEKEMDIHGNDKDALGKETVAVEEEDILLLKLRGQNGEDSRLRVKPTTTVRAMLAQYINIQGLPADTIESAKLEFDGEILELNTVIGDTEVESGDMLSVVLT